MSDSLSERNPLEMLAEEFVARFRRGERPSLSEYTSRYPTLAAEIRDLFPALVMLEDVRPEPSLRLSASDLPLTDSSTYLERLGDYRILREVGRGGMGIVYEAEQESLGRYVALKVLPRHALLDPRQLQRFQREARAAARLHHTNIVPVFGVGEEDGLHYYVMQFIHGQGLDQVLAVLRQLRRHRSTAGSSPEPDSYPEVPSFACAAPPSQLREAAAVASSLLSGVFAVPDESEVANLPSFSSVQTAHQPKRDEKGPLSPGPGAPKGSGGPGNEVPLVPRSEAVSSAELRLPGDAGQEALSDSGRPYWRSVARIGIQVAEALAYAHAQGILHRDIKPANLLLDTQGVVWVTDFGLAKSADSEDLTNTGDVVGTLRYMAPERFRSRADARSDIYALGLTLYELLTLRPAFDEIERHQLLHRMLSAEPPRPRKLNPAIPRDLETIVLKAMAPDPAHRYPSAAEMAADLRRFMDDRPIQARPVSEVEKLWRWCRRNPTLAIQAGLLLLSLVLGIIGVSWKWREAEQQRAKAEDEQGRTSRAEQEAKEQRDQAVTARNQEFTARNAAQRVSADVLLDRGLALAREGEVGSGLLWMLEALRSAPVDATDLQRVIRINLAAWLPQAHTLRHIIEQPTPVGRCAFHPDSRRFLTLLNDGSLQWWETATGKPLGTVVRKGRAEIFALSPDGARLALLLPKAATTKEGENSNSSERVQLHDAATGKPLGVPLEHPAEVVRAVFTPDGDRLVTACKDGNVRLWEAATGRLLRTGFANEKTRAHLLAISPDGKTLATGTNHPDSFYRPAVARLWNLNDGKQLGPALQHRLGLTAVCFSPDGKQLVTASRDYAARVWDVATGQPLGQPLAHTGPVWTMCFAPDGQTLFTGGEFGVNLWGRLHDLHFLGPIPTYWTQVRELAVSPDGQTLVVASQQQLDQGVIHVCDLARSLSHPAAMRRRAFLNASDSLTEVQPWFWKNFACYSPDATRLIVGGSDGFARLLDAATGQPAEQGFGPFRHYWKSVHVTAISPRGHFFATSSRDSSPLSEVQIRELATGRRSGQALPVMNYVSAMAFSPDETILATGDYDCMVRFWDPKTGKQLGPPLPQGDIVLALAFSADGKKLAVGHSRDYSGAYAVKLWDVARRRQLGQPLPDISMPFCFSPDGRRLLTGNGPTLRLWDTATGLPVGPASFEAAVIRCIAFSPDGQTILTATRDGTLRLREAQTLRAIGTPMPFGQQVTVAVFSSDPEGKYILAGYADGSAQLWDRATQKPLGPPALQAHSIVAAAFTPDGRAFLTAADDGSSRRWPVPVPLAGAPDALALRLSVATGLEMRDGQIDVRLDFKEWNQRRLQLAERERSVHPEPGAALDACTYHDARARDAEQLGDPFAAGWHLDRLIYQQERDRERSNEEPACSIRSPWLAYARRGSLRLSAGRLDLAERDYAQVAARGSPQLLLSWYRHRIAECLVRDQWRAALWYLERAIALAADDWALYADRALAYEKLERLPESDADLERAAEHGANSIFLLQTADVHARRGHWDRAAAALSRAVARGPVSLNVEHRRALAYLKIGARDDYRRVCAEVLEGVGPTPSPAMANLVAWMCAVGPDAVSDYARPVALAERAVAAVQPAARHLVLNTQGAILYRAGRFRDAIRCLEQGIQADKGQGSPYDWVFLAMAHHRLGQARQARQYLDRIAAVKNQPAASLWEALDQELLRQEAEALVRGRAADRK